MRYTIKDINAMYKDKMYGTGKFARQITKIVHTTYRDGRKISVLCSGSFKRDESGYDVEAIIDRANGENLIPECCRPAENTDDIVDVAWEMLSEELGF